ncbi:hypothetical protein [Streptomyces goshikiensis]|uniref:hypothetical protein n=1 Tax=Streptomyces goshikiensis TaxID=1942 RepID=UPI0033331939
MPPKSSRTSSRSPSPSQPTSASIPQLEKIRASKAEQRGEFAERIVWTGNR